MEFSPLITRTMKIKLHILPFFLLLSFSLFAQETVEKTTPLKPEIKLTYLDSIKKTFVKDDLAACVDSLWLKELTNLDIYSNLTEDIQTINIDEKVDFEYINKPLPNQQLAHSIINILSPENINEYGLISECIKYVEQETLEIFYNRYLLFTEESHEKNDNFIKISYKIGINLGKEILKYTYKDKALIIYDYNYQLTLNNEKFTKENLWLLGLIGHLKKSMGNTIDAIIDYKKAIEGLFEHNEPFAAAQNQLRLSEIYKQENNLLDALTIAIKSLQIIKSESGLVHLVTATAMSYIGSIYIYMEDWTQAEEYVKTSMTIREKLMGDNSTKVCINYVNYASVLANTQRTEEAEKYLNKALEIRIGKFGENHQDVASTLFEKGNLYYMTNRQTEAIEIHNKALLIRINKLGNSHYFTIKSMLKLFEIYSALEIMNDALKMEERINQSLVTLKANKDAIINELNKIKGI